MRIAIVYNRDSKRSINLFGQLNLEKYGKASIKRILSALKTGGHQAKAIEGDKDLIHKLEEFMPAVLKNERPGMVFNLSYGLQGQARYTHVPGILEMIGIPYVGSGPLAHSLALDKVVAKMIFKQQGIPTPEFSVLDAPGFAMPAMTFPLIVKPKNESVSFGVKIVNTETELRAAADVIFKQFRQAVLVEQFIDGREVNVGLLGNNPVEALPPAELLFGAGGPNIYTLEDKKHRSGRTVAIQCPAGLTPEQTAVVQDISKRAFRALGCFDCARVDLRLDKQGRFYVLEINSLPSLGEHGSYTQGAAAAGLDFTGLVNRLVEVASARYFGMPSPPELDVKSADRATQVFGYLTGRRDQIERRLADWTKVSSRTSDPMGHEEAAQKLGKRLTELGLRRMPALSDGRTAIGWETKAGMEGGTLFIGHLDVPVGMDAGPQGFRREPEMLYGEGIGCSRASLVMLEFALSALRSIRQLRNRKVGVLYYFDEGRECRYSAEVLRKAVALAKRVVVLRPGNPGNCAISQRRGQRKYVLRAEGKSRKIVGRSVKPDVLRWFGLRLNDIAVLSSHKERLTITVTDLKTTTYPMHFPHAVSGTLLISYLEADRADAAEKQVRDILRRGEYKARLELVSDRPPMVESRESKKFIKSVAQRAKAMEIPLDWDTSAWPSAAGYVPRGTPVICGIGPTAHNLYTPQECVERISLVQRTLLLAELLIDQAPVRGKPAIPAALTKACARKKAALHAG